MAGLTRQQIHAIERAVRDIKSPTVPQAEFTPGEGIVIAPQLVNGVNNDEVLSDPLYKAGWKRCHDKFTALVLWIVRTATEEELIQYAGRVPRRRSEKTDL